VASGTPPYMSPEQIRGEPLDERADLYALVVVAYELLTGKMPFAGRDTGSIFLDHLEAPPRSTRVLRPDVPAAFDALVLGLLAKSPEDRPSMDMVRAITAAINDEPGDEPSIVEIDYTREPPEAEIRPAPPEQLWPDTVSDTCVRTRWTPRVAPLRRHDTARLGQRAAFARRSSGRS
jgi:serine/threonine protein kinase